MIRRYQYDSQSLPVFTGPEDIHEANWWQPLSTPLPPKRIHVSQIPYSFWVYLPPVSGCLEIELINSLMPRTTPIPNMPAAYINQVDRWSANPPACATTRQSPATQPENGP